MNYITIALSVLWLFTLLSHTRTLRDRKRLRKSLSELYSEYRERLECHEAEKQEMEAKLKDAVARLIKNNTHLFALLRKLMYGHVYKCSTCGRFIGVGNANWDMDMKPYCSKHLKQTTPYKREEQE